MNCPVPNENQNDRRLRVVIGIVSLMTGLFFLNGTTQTIAYIIGGLGLFTGMTGVCPLYQIIGISTIKKNK